MMGCHVMDLGWCVSCDEFVGCVWRMSCDRLEVEAEDADWI